MKSTGCVAFLQRASPHLSLSWHGFGRVRGQVCKRIGHRIQSLGLEDFAAYQGHLERHPEEWAILDGFCAHHDLALLSRSKRVPGPGRARAGRASGY